MDKNDIINSTKWSCRRGMLELDIMLERFFDKKFRILPEEEQNLFRELLTCSDPELFSWLTGREVPENKQFARMVNMIREQTPA